MKPTQVNTVLCFKFGFSITVLLKRSFSKAYKKLSSTCKGVMLTMGICELGVYENVKTLKKHA